MSERDFVGQVLGKYRLLRLLGRGPSGDVYLAEHEILGNRVMVKTLPQAISRDRDLTARLMDDVRAVARLRHPNIASVHDADQAEGVDYFATDHVEGRFLAEIIDDQGPLAEEDIVAVSRQALSALETARRAGVANRAIRPENIVIDKRGEAVIIAFGPDGSAAGDDLRAWGWLMAAMASGHLADADRPTRPPRAVEQRLSPELADFVLRLWDGGFVGAGQALAALEGVDRSDEPAGLALDEPAAKGWSGPHMLDDDAGDDYQAYAGPPGGMPAKPSSRLGLWLAVAVVVFGLLGMGAWWALGPASQQPGGQFPQADPREQLLARLQVVVGEGDRLLEIGQLNEAEARYRAALEQEPGFAPALGGLTKVDAKRQASARLEQARQLFDQNRLDQAEAILREIKASGLYTSEAKEGLREIKARRIQLDRLKNGRSEADEQASGALLAMADSGDEGALRDGQNGHAVAAAASAAPDAAALEAQRRAEEARAEQERRRQEELRAQQAQRQEQERLEQERRQREQQAKAEQERKRQSLAQAQQLLDQAAVALGKDDLARAQDLLNQSRALDATLAGSDQTQRSIDFRRRELAQVADQRRQAQAQQRAAADEAAALEAALARTAARVRGSSPGQSISPVPAATPSATPTARPAAPAVRGVGPQELLVEGVRFFNEGKYQRAVENFEKVAAVYPNDKVIADYLAQAREMARAVNLGSLEVDCRVEASVFLDGRPVGSTPLLLHDVPVGRRVVEVRAYGGATRKTVEVRGRTLTKLNTMDILGASLQVDAKPAAQLFLNGKPMGDTPLALFNLPVGPATIILRAVGYQDLTVPVTLVVGQPVKLSLELKPF